MKNTLWIAMFLSFCFVAQPAYAQATTAKEQRIIIQKAQQGNALYFAGKFNEAIALWEEILPRIVGPSVSVIEFNLASSYAQIGKNDKAIEAFNKAVDHGHTEFGYVNGAAAFVKLREMPEYKTLLEKAKAVAEKKKKQLAEFPEAKDIFIEAKGIKEGEKPSLLVFLQSTGDSPELYAQFLKPIAENSNISIFIPGPSIKLLVKDDGSYGYNWDPTKDKSTIISKVDDLKNKIQAEKVYLSGIFSGASVAYIVAEFRPDIFPNIISFSGRIETQYFPEPVTIIRSSGSLKVFMVSGKQDNPQTIKRTKKFFSANGAKIFLKELQDAGLTEQTCTDSLKEAMKWFDNPETANLDNQAEKKDSPEQASIEDKKDDKAENTDKSGLEEKKSKGDNEDMEDSEEGKKQAEPEDKEQVPEQPTVEEIPSP